MAIGFKEEIKGRVFWGEAYFQTPLFLSQPGSPRLGDGRHILHCDLLLHLGMARCHVPSSWQTAVKEGSTWFPCLSRGRGAISTGGTATPILPFPTWQVVQIQLSNSQTSAPLGCGSFILLPSQDAQTRVIHGSTESYRRKSEKELIVRPNNPFSRLLSISTEV